MGDVVPFRNKRRWTRPEDYGHFPEPPDQEPDPPPKQRGKGRWRWVRGWHFWLLAVALLALWQLKDPALFGPPSWLSTNPETVRGKFTRCGSGANADCVIDGDTFKLGKRSIRIIGIDAAETHPASCDAEAQMGEKAAAELQRLLNLGPFEMVGRLDEPVDKYGRELRALRRVKANGTTQSIAAEMIASGTVRAYRSGMRADWCAK